MLAIRKRSSVLVLLSCEIIPYASFLILSFSPFISSSACPPPLPLHSLLVSSLLPPFFLPYLLFPSSCLLLPFLSVFSFLLLLAFSFSSSLPLPPSTFLLLPSSFPFPLLPSSSPSPSPCLRWSRKRQYRNAYKATTTTILQSKWPNGYIHNRTDQTEA